MNQKRLSRLAALCVCMVLSLYAQGTARSAPAPVASALLNFANLSDEKSSFDVYFSLNDPQLAVSGSTSPSLGGSFELYPGDWTILILTAGARPDSKPLYSQKVTLKPGDHVDLAAVGSFKGQGDNAFNIMVAPLNYANFSDGQQRVEFWNLDNKQPEINLRFDKDFAFKHVKYGETPTITAPDGTWQPGNIYALPDDSPVADWLLPTAALHHLGAPNFGKEQYILVVTTSSMIFDITSPHEVASIRFVNFAQNAPPLDFYIASDGNVSSQGLKYTEAGFWIDQGVVAQASTKLQFEARKHGDPRSSAPLATESNIEVKAGDSIMVMANGTYDPQTGKGIVLTSFPVPRQDQKGSATLEFVNTVDGIESISMFDGSGKVVQGLGTVKTGSVKWNTGFNPVKTDLSFVDDKTNKVLAQFKDYSIGGDLIHTFILVKNADGVEGLVIRSAAAVSSIAPSAPATETAR